MPRATYVEFDITLPRGGRCRVLLKKDAWLPREYTLGWGEGY